MASQQHRLHDKFIKEAEFDLTRGLEHPIDPRREYESIVRELNNDSADILPQVVHVNFADLELRQIAHGMVLGSNE